MVAGIGRRQLDLYFAGAAPSPTTTNGAQTEGWAAHGRSLSSINATIARRKASERPMLPSLRISANVLLVSIVAA